MTQSELTDEILNMLPDKNFFNDWEIIQPDEIKEGDYIAYIAKPRKYENGKDSGGGWRKGGFIIRVPNEEEQIKRKGNKDKIFFFRQYAKMWSVNQSNVIMFFKTKKDVNELLNKGKKKAAEKRESTYKQK